MSCTIIIFSFSGKYDPCRSHNAWYLIPKFVTQYYNTIIVFVLSSWLDILQEGKDQYN